MISWGIQGGLNKMAREIMTHKGDSARLSTLKEREKEGERV